MTELTFSYVKRITEVRVVQSPSLAWLEIEFETHTPGNKYADKTRLVLHGENTERLLVDLFNSTDAAKVTNVEPLP